MRLRRSTHLVVGRARHHRCHGCEQSDSLQQRATALMDSVHLLWELVGSDFAEGKHRLDGKWTRKLLFVMVELPDMLC